MINPENSKDSPSVDLLRVAKRQVDAYFAELYSGSGAISIVQWSRYHDEPFMDEEVLPIVETLLEARRLLAKASADIDSLIIERNGSGKNGKRKRRRKDKT